LTKSPKVSIRYLFFISLSFPAPLVPPSTWDSRKSFSPYNRAVFPVYETRGITSSLSSLFSPPYSTAPQRKTAFSGLLFSLSPYPAGLRFTLFFSLTRLLRTVPLQFFGLGWITARIFSFSPSRSFLGTSWEYGTAIFFPHRRYSWRAFQRLVVPLGFSESVLKSSSLSKKIF